MITKEKEDEDIEKLILNTMKEKKIGNVTELVESIKHNSLSGRRVIERVSALVEEKKLLLETGESPPRTFKAYIFSDKPFWFWAIVSLTFLAAAFVVAVPENAFPLVFARYAMSLFYVLFVPGYALLRAIPIKSDLEDIEGMFLSLALSITLIFLTGLVLNYLPWGFTLYSIVSSLITVAIVLSTVAMGREYALKYRKGMAQNTGR